MIVFLNGNFSELDEIKISPFDRGFLYADGVYEVLRKYSRNFFRYNDHIERLKYSLSETQINYKDFVNLEKIIDELIEKNNFHDIQAQCYIEITRGEYYPRMHPFPPENIKPTIFIWVSPIIRNQNEIEKGVKVILEKDVRWLRCDIKSVSLLPAVMAREKAKKLGAREAVLVRDGFITEGTHTNFFGIKNGELFTHPLNNLILSGITRKVVLEICNDLRIKINEEPIKEKNIHFFDEFFITGTNTEITPVIKINDMIIGNGEAGKITGKIQEKFFSICV